MTTAKFSILKSFKSITLTRNYPVNIIEKDKPLFNKLLEARVQEIKVVSVINATIISNGAIIKNLTVLPQSILSNDNGEIVSYSKRGILKIILFWPRISLKKQKDYFVIHNVFSDTYYHWLLEALPRLFIIREQITSGTLLLPSNHNQKFHQESLSIFGIVDVGILHEKVRYLVPRTITSTQIGRIANYHPEILKEMVQYIKSKIDCSLDFGEKVYISRSRAVRRKVVNEQQLEIFLAGLGFKAINFEDYSFESQISIMHCCKYLIGIHGAGLANMIFMEEGGKIMELRKHDCGENYFYFSLAATVNHSYYYQFCDSVDDQGSVQDADILVDFQEFKMNVQSMLE